MSDDEVSKKKLPRDAAHFIDIEDKLKEIEAILRDMRQGMANIGMESVDLMTGTLIHQIALAKENALALKGKFDSQVSAFERSQSQKRVRNNLKNQGQN